MVRFSLALVYKWVLCVIWLFMSSVWICVMLRLLEADSRCWVCRFNFESSRLTLDFDRLYSSDSVPFFSEVAFATRLRSTVVWVNVWDSWEWWYAIALFLTFLFLSVYLGFRSVGIHESWCYWNWTRNYACPRWLSQLHVSFGFMDLIRVNYSPNIELGLLYSVWCSSLNLWDVALSSATHQFRTVLVIRVSSPFFFLFGRFSCIWERLSA